MLWDYCDRTGYDFYVVRDVIFERIGRKLVCKCELLRDDEKRRRMELEKMFGVDFGGPEGEGVGVGLVYCSACFIGADACVYCSC